MTESRRPGAAMTPRDPRRVTLGDLLGVDGHLLDPDPLRPPETDYPQMIVTGEAKASARMDQWSAFLFGMVAGMVLVLALIVATVAAMPRSGPDPTTGPPRDLSGQPADTSGQSQSGAPRPPVVIPAAAPNGLSVDPAASGNPPAVGAPLTVAGPATWYDAPSIRDAAAGPRLRSALGPHWRGSTVRVCAKACITVRLTDWCACGSGRVIDLDDRAFARLAPLSQGIVRVRITVVGQIDVPLTSGPTAPPTDVE